MKRGRIQRSFFFFNSKIEAELNPVQTEPSDRRGMAAEKLCQAPLKFQAGDSRVEAASGGDRSSLVPSRQHGEAPDKERGQNGGPREGRALLTGRASLGTISRHPRRAQH